MSATTGHPHAALMLEYAKDWAETKQPWERWELKEDVSNEWRPFIDGHPSWLDDFQYRRIPTPPPTLFINGIEVTEPVREPLNDGDRYFIPDLCGAADDIEWASDCWDMENLRDGLIHLTKESAEIHRKALLSFTAKEEAQ